MPKLGLLIGGQHTPIVDIVALGKAAEDAGFDSVWCPEFWRSAFVPLTAIATATQRMRLVPAVAMGFVRSPFLHARAAFDLDELSGGRYVLGLGTGTLRMELGWKTDRFPPPVDGMREYITAVRSMWEAWRRPGAPARFRGRHYSFDLPGYMGSLPPARPRVPIHLSAVQPGMLRLAGELADGVVGYPMASARYIREELRPNIEEGARRAGRSLDGFEVCMLYVAAVSEDRESARRMARRQLAFYGTSLVYRGLLERDGFGEEWQAIQNAAGRDDLDAMSKAVSDEMLDTLAIAGTPEECRARVTAMEDLADVVVLHPPQNGLSAKRIVEEAHQLLRAFATAD